MDFARLVETWIPADTEKMATLSPLFHERPSAGFVHGQFPIFRSVTRKSSAESQDGENTAHCRNYGNIQKLPQMGRAE